MCRKWTVLSGRSPRVWRNICSKEIPNLRHGGFGTPRAFPHQLIGCGRVKVDPKQGEGWHIGCLTSGGCGGMVCGKVSHYHGMSDRWDKVWGPLLKPMVFFSIWSSYGLLVDFIWINLISFHKKFMRSSFELRMKYIRSSQWILMQFKRISCKVMTTWFHMDFIWMSLQVHRTLALSSETFPCADVLSLAVWY